MPRPKIALALLVPLLVTGCLGLPQASTRPHFKEDDRSPAEAMAPEAVFSIGAGPSSDAFGSIKDHIGGPASTTIALKIEAYGSARNGFFGEFSGQSLSEDIDSAYFGHPPLKFAGASSISLGPSFRQFFGERTTGVFQPGISAIQVIAADTSWKNVGRTLRGLGLSASYTFAFRYGRLAYGEGFADFEIAVTPAVFYYPYFDAGRRDIGIATVTVDFLRIGL